MKKTNISKSYCLSKIKNLIPIYWVEGKNKTIKFNNMKKIE